MSEQSLVNAIIDYLHLRGCYALRINSGMRPIENKDGSYRMVKFAPPGTPDILACVNGRFVGIECKVGRNKPSPQQVNNHEQIRAAGGVAIVAYDIQDVEEILEAVK